MIPKSILTALVLIAAGVANGKSDRSKQVWQFAVSGDSRDCGNIIMPAIARSVAGHQAAFYWHLGDFRKIYGVDEDTQHEPAYRARPLTHAQYLGLAWQDFIDNQLRPFGSLPVFLGIGNHDVLPPETREELLVQFAGWFDAPAIHQQRLADDPHDYAAKTYYHWIVRGIDFINLDNATDDQFQPAQLAWFESVLHRDEDNPSVLAIVVGMHKPFPDGLTGEHGMAESDTGLITGRRAVEDLQRAVIQCRKRVYVVASHEHYFLANDLNTLYWRTHGGVLPAWIIGSAGAPRYPLPTDLTGAGEAKTHVYGYLLASVGPAGEIRFQFIPIHQSDVATAIVRRYTPPFVHWCFAENTG